MTPSGGVARAAAIAVLLSAAAGCASGSPASSGRQSVSAPPSASPIAAPGSGGVGLPGCTTSGQAGRNLPASATAMTALFPEGPQAFAAGPFGVAVAATGNWGFATSVPVPASAQAVNPGSPSPDATPASPPASPGQVGLDVLRLAPGHAPVLVRTIPVPGPTAGAALSDNGRLLLVAGGAGAVVVSVPAAEQGGEHAVLGTLAAPGNPLAGAIEVAITPDGRYAFVSLEDADRIAVFSLARAMAAGFRDGSGYIGSIPTGVAPVGLAVSPGGRWLYATTESNSGPMGSLSVISVARAESDPARSVAARVPAGCTPVRVITSAGGSVVWVAARGSDALLAFSAASLQTDPSHALLADVPVGKAPVGLALARAGTLIVAADSNRFAPGFPVSNLAVVSVAAALAGRPALLGYLPAGRFPRDVAASASGSVLLVANYASGQAETVNPAALP